MKYFIHNWRNTFTVHVSNLITVEFLLFIKSQFHNKCSKILHLNQCTYGHVWSRTVAPFQWSRHGCEWFDRHKKCVGKVFPHFQLALNTTGCLSVPTDTNIWNWDERGLYLENCLRTNIDMNFFLDFMWGINYWNLSKHLDTPCIVTASMNTILQTLRDTRVTYARSLTLQLAFFTENQITECK